jgi:ubiquitin conjugation factor E4 B
MVAEDKMVMDKFVRNLMFDPVDLSSKFMGFARTVPDIPGDRILGFERFLAMVREHRAVFEAEDVDFSDAPPEFFDELTADPMMMPMRLPSGHVLDKECLEKMLLSNPHDPFTMTVLHIEDCVLDVELKRRIDEFRAAKLNRSGV